MASRERLECRAAQREHSPHRKCAWFDTLICVAWDLTFQTFNVCVRRRPQASWIIRTASA